MNELSLFTGAGGGIWGTKLLGWRTVGYVEIDEYCQKVIAQRIRDGVFDDAPIFGDIRAFIDEGWPLSYSGMVDVITAGTPCQGHSSAARGRNVAPDLWAETFDVIKYVSPRYVMLENVAGAHEFMRKCGDWLRQLDYSSRWGPVSASELGAPFIGERLWLVAEANRKSESAISEYVQMAELPTAASSLWADVDRGDLGMVDGDAHRVDRLRAAGNAQIPRMVVEAWRRLSS